VASCFDLRLVLTNEMTSANEIAAESSYLCVKTYEYVTANCFLLYSWTTLQAQCNDNFSLSTRLSVCLFAG